MDFKWRGLTKSVGPVVLTPANAANLGVQIRRHSKSGGTCLRQLEQIPQFQRRLSNLRFRNLTFDGGSLTLSRRMNADSNSRQVNTSQ